jgi:hypothetical protein
MFPFLVLMFFIGSHCLVKIGIKSPGKRGVRVNPSLISECRQHTVPFKSKLHTHLTPFQVPPHSPFVLNPAPTPIEKSATQDQKNHSQSYCQSHCQMGFAIGYREAQHYPRFIPPSHMSSIPS